MISLVGWLFGWSRGLEGIPSNFREIQIRTKTEKNTLTQFLK